MIRSLLLFAYLVACLSVKASDLPSPVEIKYKVSWNGIVIGQATDRLEHDGKHYSIVSDTKTVGMAALIYKLTIRRESKGTITNTGLVPGTFAEERTKKPRRQASFDWATRQLTLDSGDEKKTVPLPDHAFDQSTFAWSFAFVPPQGKEGKVALTDGRKLSEYRYLIVGKEKLKTAIGEVETVHVKKILEGDDKRGFEFWLASERYFLPVRILFVDDDTTVDSVIIQLSIAGKS